MRVSIRGKKGEERGGEEKIVGFGKREEKRKEKREEKRGRRRR